MKILLYLFTTIACGFLYSCAPTVTMESLEKSLANEIRPITKPPKEILTGAWRSPTGGILIFHKNGACSYANETFAQWSPFENNDIPKGQLLLHNKETNQFLLTNGSLRWAYSGDKKRGVLSDRIINPRYGEDKITDISIKFINDNKIIRKLDNAERPNVKVGLYTRTKMKKAPKVPKVFVKPKRRSASSGIRKAPPAKKQKVYESNF